MKKIIILFAVIGLFSGCASTAIQKSEFNSKDFGTYPENYEKISKEWFNEVLKDPFSAKYRFETEPRKAYSRKAPAAGGNPNIFGYVIFVDVNAKNSMGGYTGWEEYRLLIRNGEVKQRIIPNMFFKESWYQE